MLDSLYEKTLENKDNIKESIEIFLGNINVDPSMSWRNYPITETDVDVTISAGDGSINKKKFLDFIFYVIDAECLVYNKGIKTIESSEVDIIPHHRYVEDRLRSYMGIFEIKNALRAFEQYDIDLLLFDGSILGNLIRPFPLQKELQNTVKEKIKVKYLPMLEKELKHSKSGICSSKFFKLIENDFKNKIESMIYLENLESLLVISKLLMRKEKVVAISKTSTNNDYFDCEIPDMAIFDKFKKEGYSEPKYLNVSKRVKREFPVCNEFFRSLTFTIFYARLEDHKNILKFELPYKATEDEIKNILSVIKGNSVEGYPYLLKKAHNDVVIRKTDIERLSKIIGFLEKSGREML